MQKILSSERHTRTTVLFSISRLFEKASFYGVRSLLLMYMIRGGLNLSEENSIAIYGYFVGSIIFSQLLGCVIGDLILGNKKTILLGGLLQALGTFIICIQSPQMFYVGIGLISLGNGLFSPNIMSRFGKHYLNKKTLLDGGFSILSLAVSIGAMLGPFLTSLNNCIYGFIISGILILIATSFHFFIDEKENTEFYNTNESTKQNINSILLILFGIVLFWFMIDFIQVDLHLLGDRINTLSSTTGIDTMTATNAVFSFVFVIIASFLWSFYCLNQLSKLFISIIVSLIALLILYVFTHYCSPLTIGFILISLLTSFAEMFVSPILSSTLVKYTNTKYLTLFIGLSYIPFQLVNYLKLDNYYSYVYYIIFILIITWIILYSIFKPKSSNNFIQ